MTLVADPSPPRVFVTGASAVARDLLAARSFGGGVSADRGIADAINASHARLSRRHSTMNQTLSGRVVAITGGARAVGEDA
ncbi:hypothetical protein AS9A_0789 [Hoyosella subflava DQS3-9A1]|uniref:Uncharacterized protein n=1 Tax=Hoyosella subflava (strain DSM 45089 / JCM 17490 / NBRC 109087 / DQS3-9A1) TaxID=443218 RepID=F6ELE9_HOYSD|nr:hypothetical protein AS9A_0789 [Hoyosella subflava DQS3-9A1]